MAKERSEMTQTTESLPLDLEGLTPEEAAKVLKRHNPRLRGSEEMLAKTIRQVRAGETKPVGDAAQLIHKLLAEQGE
jgi:hypothetical protein